MNWINVETELPKTRKRFIALCQNNNKEGGWNGIIDVFFDPRIGWSRCESQDIRPVYVIFYTDHPYPDWPWTPLTELQKQEEK